MAARPRFTSRAQAFAASSALYRGIAAAGGHEAVAHRLGVTGQTVRSWTFCPTARLAAVSAVLGVPARDLRPDLHLFAVPPTAEQAIAAHLAAGRHFALTGRTLSSERH